MKPEEPAAGESQAEAKTDDATLGLVTEDEGAAEAFALSDDGLMSVTEAWARDNQATLERVELAAMVPTPTLEAIAAWTDDEVKAVDLWAYATCLEASDNDVQVPNLPDALKPPPPPPVAVKPTKPIRKPPAAQAAEPRLPTVDEYQVLKAAQSSVYGLYRYPETGYGVGGGQFLAVLVQACLDKDWLYEEPSGGNHGSVKISPTGRQALKQPAPAARSPRAS